MVVSQGRETASSYFLALDFFAFCCIAPAMYNVLMSSIAAMWSPLLFGFALFLSAALLFLVQPMVARTLLPHLGGNPIAWNACLVFFQATLLAGYVYVGLLHRFRGLRWQPWVQLLLMAA